MEDKKRKVDNLLSPEKRAEAGAIIDGLERLKDGALEAGEVEDIMGKLSVFMSDYIEDEILLRMDKMDKKLDQCTDNMATKIQIRQLEAQLTAVQQDSLAKDAKIHDLIIKNAELETRMARLENFR